MVNQTKTSAQYTSEQGSIAIYDGITAYKTNNPNKYHKPMDMSTQIRMKKGKILSS